MTIWQHVACLAAALVCVGFIYAGHRTAGFVYEDARWQDAYGPGRQAPVGVGSRPLMRWSWWLQAQVAPSPFAFHAVSLGLHVVASALVGALAWRLGCSAAASWVAASVFLLNITQVEAVAYAAGRADILAAIGVLAACVSLAGPWSWGVLAGGVLGAVVGFAGKESAIAVLALGPLVARRWRTALVGGGVMAAVVAIAAARRTALADGAWALVQTTAAYRLAASSVLPVGHTVDYDYDALSIATRLVAAIVMTTLAAAAWRLRHVQPRAAIGGLWVMACVLPRLVMATPTSYLNDHQFYLAVAGVALLAAAFVDTGFRAPAPV